MNTVPENPKKRLPLAILRALKRHSKLNKTKGINYDVIPMASTLLLQSRKSSASQQPPNRMLTQEESFKIEKEKVKSRLRKEIYFNFLLFGNYGHIGTKV